MALYVGKRRFADHAAEPTTVIGAGSVVDGDLRGGGSFAIAGEVHGDGELGGFLSLAPGAVWRGRVHAAAALVAGRVEGSLRVDGKLELRSSAVITGSVSAEQIAIARGAVVDGEVAVRGDIVEFEEKRFD